MTDPARADNKNFCTFIDTTRVNPVPIADGTYTIEVQACNTKGCSDWVSVSDILVPGGPSPPVPADDWLVQNQYQISLAFYDEVNTIADVAEYQVFWDEADGSDAADFVEAWKDGTSASGNVLLAADFDANSYTDADSRVFYMYTMFIKNSDPASRLQAGSTYCFRYKTKDTSDEVSDYSDATCATLDRYRRTQIVGADFPLIGNGS